MSSNLVHVGILVGVALVLFIGLVSIIHALIVARRLHLLSTDVIVHNPDTLRRVQEIRCEGCHSKRHVDLYQYGSDTSIKAVYLCYLCVPRLEHTIQKTVQAYLASHPQHSSQEVYTRFTSGSHQRKGS